MVLWPGRPYQTPASQSAPDDSDQTTGQNEHQHQKLIRWIRSPNIADEIDEDILSALGHRAKREYEIDVESRAERLTKTRTAMDLAMQVAQEKTYPWPRRPTSSIQRGGGVNLGPCRPGAGNRRSGIMMTKEELIEAACEIIGVNMTDLSDDQIERLTAITHHLADLSLNENASFGHLCAIRTTIDVAVTAATTDDLVTVGLTKEQCTFLLALIDREIREHA